jgi:hypothetical protein
MRGFLARYQPWLGSLTVCATLVASLAAAAIVRADNPQIAYITNDGRSIHLVGSGGDGDRQLLAANGTLGAFDETYTVEYLNGGWIVTKNDLH